MTTDKARSLAEQIEASVNQLAIETDQARQSELFKNWLNAMAQFSNYSWNNQLLIAFQRPAASSGQVAGSPNTRNQSISFHSPPLPPPGDRIVSNVTSAKASVFTTTSTFLSTNFYSSLPFFICLTIISNIIRPFPTWSASKSRGSPNGANKAVDSYGRQLGQCPARRQRRAVLGFRKPVTFASLNKSTTYEIATPDFLAHSYKVQMDARDAPTSLGPDHQSVRLLALSRKE